VRLIPGFHRVRRYKNEPYVVARKKRECIVCGSRSIGVCDMCELLISKLMWFYSGRRLTRKCILACLSFLLRGEHVLGALSVSTQELRTKLSRNPSLFRILVVHFFQMTGSRIRNQKQFRLVRRTYHRLKHRIIQKKSNNISAAVVI
jgi:hypothetical protein